jgi:hypothetical protein
MYAGEALKRVHGLTNDKLIYFVRAGYVRPRKIKKKSLHFNDFPEKDVEVIRRAWELISKHDVRTRAAFERVRREAEDPQIRLNLRTPPNNSD